VLVEFWARRIKEQHAKCRAITVVANTTAIAFFMNFALPPEVVALSRRREHL